MRGLVGPAGEPCNMHGQGIDYYTSVPLCRLEVLYARQYA